MKRNFKKIIALFLCFATLILLICSCGKKQTAATPTDATSKEAQGQTATVTPAINQSNSPVFMLEELPEIGKYVDDIIYKRRYTEKRETLTPGENHGKLIPFIESFKEYHLIDYETGEWRDETCIQSKYGLMTTEGEVIVDAVYDWYNILPCEKYGYLIELSIGSEIAEKTLICPSDGSWVIEDENINIGNYPYGENEKIKNFLVINDRTEVDSDYENGVHKLLFYNLDGKKMFEIDYAFSYESGDFSEGYYAIEYYYNHDNGDSHGRFIDTKGNFVFDGVHPYGNFKNGVAIARNDNNKYGIFSSSGKWVVNPYYDNIYINDGHYIADIADYRVILDKNLKTVDRIKMSDLGDMSMGIMDGRVYFEVSNNDGYDYYIYADTREKIICKEIGIPVTNTLYGKDMFYCNYGEYTYLVDINGNTVKKLEGSGRPWNISDEYFCLEDGNWEDDYQKCTVYSYDGYKKIWSGTQKNFGDRINFHFYDEFIITSYTEEKYVDEFLQKQTYDLTFYEDDEPFLKGITDYRSCEINEDFYLFYSDGVYTYTLGPDLNVLMKVRNDDND